MKRRHGLAFSALEHIIKHICSYRCVQRFIDTKLKDFMTLNYSDEYKNDI